MWKIEKGDSEDGKQVGNREILGLSYAMSRPIHEHIPFVNGFYRCYYNIYYIVLLCSIVIKSVIL